MAPVADVSRPPMDHTTNCFPWPLRASESSKLSPNSRRSVRILTCDDSSLASSASSARPYAISSVSLDKVVSLLPASGLGGPAALAADGPAPSQGLSKVAPPGTTRRYRPAVRARGHHPPSRPPRSSTSHLEGPNGLNFGFLRLCSSLQKATGNIRKVICSGGCKKMTLKGLTISPSRRTSLYRHTLERCSLPPPYRGKPRLKAISYVACDQTIVA